MDRFVSFTKFATAETTSCQCSFGRRTPPPPNNKSSVIAPFQKVRSFAIMVVRGSERRGQSSKKCSTVSVAPHSHCSLTLENHRDFEALRLLLPRRSRARMVCSFLVPTKNAGDAEMPALNLDKCSVPLFCATVENHLRCS